MNFRPRHLLRLFGVFGAPAEDAAELAEPQRFGTETWSVIVPVGWRAWHEDGSSRMAAHDFVGMLQVKAVFKAIEALDGDLRALAAEHLAAGVQSHEATAGEFVGFQIAFESESILSKQWYLRNGEQMLFVTYGCGVESRGVEDEQVLGILDSLLAAGDSASHD